MEKQSFYDLKNEHLTFSEWTTAIQNLQNTLTPCIIAFCFLNKGDWWTQSKFANCFFLLLTLSVDLLLTGTISLSHSPTFEAIFEGVHLSPNYMLVYSFPPSLLSSWILPYVACKIFTSFWEHGSLNHCGLRNKDLQEKPYFARRTHSS